MTMIRLQPNHRYMTAVGDAFDLLEIHVDITTHAGTVVTCLVRSCDAKRRTFRPSLDNVLAWKPTRDLGPIPDHARCFAHVAIRKTEDSGKEWIQLTSVGCISEQAEANSQETNLRCGESWSKANPVVRIARVKVTEVE
jgi:hypothetical protein